jgi:hypothetical protein
VVIKLPDVTLVMIETRDHELAKMAVDDCVKHCDFGDVLIFSDKPMNVPGAHQTRIETIGNLEDVARLLWVEVPKHVTTSHMLIAQWDGWVIDPGMWSDCFLDCDYVGAPWWYGPLGVGNGGFSLRSCDLMRHLSKSVAITQTMGEDVAICRALRWDLGRQGFKFPTSDMALRFSFECLRESNDSRHFGFHAFRNWPLVLSDDELIERFALCKDHAYGENRMQLNYFMNNWEHRRRAS